jgi:protein-L-isoaspartate(D-aspartate) O-methyltransferase
MFSALPFFLAYSNENAAHMRLDFATMTDFATARRMMVDGQVHTSDVTDPRILAAMLELPRERFVPQDKAGLAYFDLDLPVTPAKPGQAARCLLKPMVLAKMVQAAALIADDHVLDVGCATGYSSALLARLAGSVVALEEDEALARPVRDNLAASEVVPQTLGRQLKEGGRLVAVLGRAPASQAMVYRCVGGEISGWPVFDAAAPLLPGFAAPPAFVF